MIVWRVARQSLPEHLAGCQVARLACVECDQVSVAAYADMLPIETQRWVRLGDGYEAAQVGKFVPTDYLRPERWSMRLAVEDGRGWEWVVPALLSPEGAVLADRSWVLDDSGGWVRRALCDRHDRAISAAQAAHPLVNTPAEIPEESLIPWACAIVEAAYYLDSRTIGRLGLLTTTSALAIVRGAAGWIPEAA